MDTSIPLSQASFIMSHGSATGYLPSISPKRPMAQALALYSKTQVGSVYDQLNNGARALDLRPKLLQNGTIIFHHGTIPIRVCLEKVLQDVIRWCSENSDELVLILPSHVQYESSTDYNDGGYDYVSTISKIYDSFGIRYVHCMDVYGLTVGEAMEMAALSSGNGYVLALDGQNYYGSFCGKSNWVESLIVTCYSYPVYDNWEYQRNNNDDEVKSRITNIRCTESMKDKTQPLATLKKYVMASANNDPTSDYNVLGPSVYEYYHTFNEIQALWQLDSHAVTSGLQHFSSQLEDNRRSGLNKDLVEWIYNGDLDYGMGISLLAVDNVVLHGNAILSVLRNRCGQSEEEQCGISLDMPQLFYITTTTFVFWGISSMSVILVGMASWYYWSKHWKKVQEDVNLLYNSYMVSS